jgi:hypothetical protein
VTITQRAWASELNVETPVRTLMTYRLLAVTLPRESAPVGLSQRKACTVATCNRKTFRHVLRRTDDAVLLQRLHELAAERRRFGYLRLDIFLRRDGIVANHIRIY